MATHTFDVAAFRTLFPAFADDTKYPDALLSGYFQMATCFISPNDNCLFSGDCLQTALNLMTAHLASVYTVDATGALPGIGVITSASIDKISVTMQVPTTTTAYSAFLLRSPYGLQLVALLKSHAAGGWTVGGSYERQGFRKAGGVF